MVEVRVEVTLRGKTYRLTCDEADAPLLRDAARLLDERLARLSGEGLSGEKLLLWAAFEIATELIRTQRQGGFDIAGFQRRIERMGARLDRLLAECQPSLPR
ncbi:cell division protein ZapA [Hydrogenophilus thermoluteolus]|uniref:Cell division protein ZapA n=1 Tax=Hydrogenophilus thermoluteolus TaxID=297 RepID=A0A2Z6DZP4_HYDTE|nr:cell division protein ZapA [Hydrogenophilus thermoluteolus]BBD78001.1 cell division protein ZapA [Hydrogenophilus thermoluteolus]GLW60335.1 hypothetical protein Hthe01_06840 [Hydrogenophilus thermoluteolus]